MAQKYELVFVGGTKRRYQRWHSTIDSAKDTAARVLLGMSLSGDPTDEQRSAHPAIIYGPDCGRDGITLA